METVHVVYIETKEGRKFFSSKGWTTNLGQAQRFNRVTARWLSERLRIERGLDADFDRISNLLN